MKQIKSPEQALVPAKADTPETRENRIVEDQYEQALALSHKEGKASCYRWMASLKIPYGRAVTLMDMMEERGTIKPLKYKDGILQEPHGPRELP